MSQAKNEGQASAAKKENQITQLSEKLESAELQKTLAVNEALDAVKQKSAEVLAQRDSKIQQLES